MGKVGFTLRRLYPTVKARKSIEYGAGWNPETARKFSDKIKMLPTQRFLGHSTLSLVDVKTELNRLELLATHSLKRFSHSANLSF
jgi:hypothetical protein